MNEPSTPTSRPGHSLSQRARLKGTYMLREARASAAEKLFHAIRGGRRRELLLLSWPTSVKNEARYGDGLPPHRRLQALLSGGDDRYRGVLEGFQQYTPDLLAIPNEKGDPREPHWHNTLLFGLDGVSLYSFVRERRPKRYFEVGSGNSTLFVDRARRDGELDMQITSIDPDPRREVDEICDRVMRQPFETVDLKLFEELEAGDIVYFDCSHRVFMNSDVTAFFLDVLPELPPGILVGIHDIYLPEDYRTRHARRYWSEQYLLAALLLGEPDWLTTVLPCRYVSAHPGLGDLARAICPPATYSLENPHGLSFWLSTGTRS